jgi:condensin complex subunit 3
MNLLCLLKADKSIKIDKQLRMLENQIKPSDLELLIKGLDSANKLVRYRSCQILLVYLNCVDSDEYNLVDPLCSALLDKDSSVRAMAAAALSRFQNDSSIISHLITALKFDSSAEVRKSVLLNLEITLVTVESLFSRSRDTDSSVRKALFRKLATDKFEKTPDLAAVLLTGLKDRDPLVAEVCHSACKHLFPNYPSLINVFII